MAQDTQATRAEWSTVPVQSALCPQPTSPQQALSLWLGASHLQLRIVTQGKRHRASRRSIAICCPRTHSAAGHCMWVRCLVRQPGSVCCRSVTHAMTHALVWYKSSSTQSVMHTVSEVRHLGPHALAAVPGHVCLTPPNTTALAGDP